MSELKKETGASKKQSASSAYKFPADALIKSDKFKNYQKDLVKSTLGSGEYTVSEAVKLVENALKQPIKDPFNEILKKSGVK